MSRIREALTKIEGVPRELERPRYERTAYAEPVYAEPSYAEPSYPAPAPPYEVPVAQEYPAPYEEPYEAEEPAPAAEPLPGLPAEFHRELSALRSTLESALADRVTRVVQFSAAVPGEGTTTVAANFARVLAQDPSQHVLLIDANVRRPGLSLFFGLPEGHGLREILHGDAAAEAARAIVAVERPNLHVMTALRAGGELTHLFAPEAVREFWARFGARYHWVILDAPPVLEAPETSTLGATVDTTVLVIEAARTKRGVVQRAMEVCAKAGAPVLGAVLNRRRHDIPEFIYRRI